MKKNIFIKQSIIIISTILIFNLFFPSYVNAISDSFSSINNFLEARK